MRSSAIFWGFCAVLSACAESAGVSPAPTDSGTDAGPSVTDAATDEDEQEEEEEEEIEEDGGTHGPCEDPGPDEDIDGDGLTKATGDCNECSPQINAGAYDFPGNEYDEDCSGTPAEPGEDACDDGLDMDSSDARDAARALGLCKFTSEGERGWGVLSARFTRSTGEGVLANPHQAGLLPELGAAKPRAGKSLLALSSGVARAPDQEGVTTACDSFQSTDVAGTPPLGYPKDSSLCPVGMFAPNTKVYNEAALELTIRVPTNARSYGFDSIFYTMEYPRFVCDKFNDFFVVLQSPRVAALADENIVFDANGNPIGANTALLEVCNADDQLIDGPRDFECAQGTALLAGTGFGAGEFTCVGEMGLGGASTGWLHTTVPVMPNTIITVRFAVWDTGDQLLDSTVLVDKWEWSVEEPVVATTPVIL